ncbi:hypothetical protein [Actinopolyspora halophila]|uniref:hypothetical protein n=1 Tax=Actinopolyspora halophila TaxID=1850 RepID=UPI00036E1FAB|nr:hypothetical protein [Actinopolyspora halophila]
MSNDSCPQLIQQSLSKGPARALAAQMPDEHKHRLGIVHRSGRSLCVCVACTPAPDEITLYPCAHVTEQLPPASPRGIP